MSTRYFKSKIDRWILVLLLAVMVGEAGVLLAVAAAIREPLQVTLTILCGLLVLALLGSLLLRTGYTVGKDQLTVVCGPFRWRIPLADIRSIEPSRSLLSSPALSLDRLRIGYGDDKYLLVSPADRRGFLRAVGHSTGASGEGQQ